MKILWLCSQPLNIIAEKLSLPKVYLGGWLEGIAKNLSKKEDVELYYLFINDKKEGVFFHLVDNINFIEVGIKRFSSKEISFVFEGIVNEFNFEIIHIFGTENHLINELAKRIDSTKLVLSIQGILSEIYKKYCYKIFKYHWFKNLFTQIFGDILLFYNQNQLNLRAKSEIKVLSRTKNIIGRTAWDKEFINSRFPLNEYYHNGEILRSEFYSSKKWDNDKIKKYRIFVSQGSYPIKGLHFVLKALSILKQTYPNIELVIAGENILNNQVITSKIGISYSNFIENILEIEELTSNVRFLGALDASQMITELLQCNCFVLASTIENSPNSLGEAMILGVPCISSNVGGIPSMVEDEVDCILFQSGNAEELSLKIDRVFSEEYNIKELSKNCIEKANKLFNRESNISQLVDIYRSIIKSNTL